MQPLLPTDPQQMGPYRLTGRLGSGGMGNVYLGHSRAGRAVAVKVVRPEIADEPGFRDRFRREVGLAMRVGGFWTAAVIDTDPDGPTPWVASQYVPGPALAAVVTEARALDEETVRFLAVGLAEALAAFHAGGLVHRDLKPANILLAQDGPRVIDFGISKAMDDSTGLTRTGTVMGTPGYMSPEQAVGDPTGTPSDIFSFGAVLAFAATGSGPFGQGATHALLYRVVHDEPDLTAVPERLRPVVAACLAKRPGERPTARDLLARIGTDMNAADGPPPGWPSAPEAPHGEVRTLPADPGPRAGPTQPPHTPPPTHPPTAAYTEQPVQWPAPMAPAPGGGPVFLVRDGGGRVFRRRMKRSVNSALLLMCVVGFVCLTHQVVAPLAVSGAVAAVILLVGLSRSLPLLAKGMLRVDGNGLALQQGDVSFQVPWWEVAHVSFAHAGQNTFSLLVTAVLRADARTPVPAALRRKSPAGPLELEYRLVSLSKPEMATRTGELHIALSANAPAVYRPNPMAFPDER